MGQVLRFPTKYRGAVGFDAATTDIRRYHQLVALRDAFQNIRSGEFSPAKLFMVFGEIPGPSGEWTWSYLNLGFASSADLMRAIDKILDDMKKPG